MTEDSIYKTRVTLLQKLKDRPKLKDLFAAAETLAPMPLRLLRVPTS